MTRISILVFSLLASSAGTVAAQPRPAFQTMPQATPDADALAGAMRTLGANPRDLNALITAGELSLKLGDASAAAALFKRADQIDPMNGRVKAGMARILVSQERPGEALRYFDQAAGYGLDTRTFAGDRGLAYDLIGEQERAQRDYRAAMRDGQQDEVQRRYALSLAISGKQDEALKQIDALVRKGDRGAWRARAFILAMGGDVPGAEKIATSMMPPGMAAGLAPFFGRLPALGAVDKAFAVHFGEVRPTATRLADMKLAPALPALGPEAGAAVTIASAPPPPAMKQSSRDRRQRDRRSRDKSQHPVMVAGLPAAPQPLPAPPSYGNGVTYSAPREIVQNVPARVTSAAPSSVATQTTTGVAPSRSVATPTRPGQSAPSATAAIVPSGTAASQVAATTPRTTGSAQPSVASPVTTVAKPAAPIVAQVPASQTVTPVPASIGATVVPKVASVASSAGPVPAVASSKPVGRAMSEDTILARIMAGISVPASELAETPVPRTAPPTPAPTRSVTAPSSTIAPKVATRQTKSAPAAVTTDEPDTKTSRAARKGAKASPDATEQADDVAAAKPVKGGRRGMKASADAEAETVALDPKAEKKKAADRKAAAAKKLADAKKAAEIKEAAEEKKAARAEPSRIWVQVAGGANEADLPKAWAATKAKSSTLAGRSAYSTPLRATNRVVTGPFKTDAEARAFVNKLAKEGVSAFSFTSTAGQKMTKLPAK